MNPILIGHLLPEVPPCIERTNSRHRMPPLHKSTSQSTKAAMASRMIPQPAETKGLSVMTSGGSRQWREGDSRGITMRRALCCVPRRKGGDLPLGRSFLSSVVSNVVAFCHQFLPMKKPKRSLNQTPAVTRLNRAAPQTFHPPPPSPSRKAVRESQALMMRLRPPAEG